MTYQLVKYHRRVDIRQESIVPAVIYNGPGDVVSGASSWWGLRAYNSASRGANTVRLRRDSDNAEQTFVTGATGGLDTSAISSFKGGANLFVVTLHDQVGSHTLSQGTSSVQPPFILAALGSNPVFRFTATGEWLDGPGTLSISQPMTHSTVAKRTGAGGSIITGSGSEFNSGFSSSADLAKMHAGTTVTATAVTGNWHSINAAFNGASSDLNINGSANSVNPGTNVATTSTRINGAFAFVGDVVEMGAWPIAFSGTQSTNMSANQHSYWGF